MIASFTLSRALPRDAAELLHAAAKVAALVEDETQRATIIAGAERAVRLAYPSRFRTDAQSVPVHYIPAYTDL